MTVEYDSFTYTVISEDVQDGIVFVTIQSLDTEERFGVIDSARMSTGYTITEYNDLEPQDWTDRLIDLAERRVDDLMDAEKDKELAEAEKDQVITKEGTNYTVEREKPST